MYKNNKAFMQLVSLGASTQTGEQLVSRHVFVVTNFNYSTVSE